MKPRPKPTAYDNFDLLATLVAVVSPQGECLFVNAAFEDLIGLSRRSLVGGQLPQWFVLPRQLQETLAAVARNDYSSGRFDAQLRRVPGMQPEVLPVHVIVNQ